MCVHACVRACVHACMRAHASMEVRAWFCVPLHAILPQIYNDATQLVQVFRHYRAQLDSSEFDQSDNEGSLHSALQDVSSYEDVCCGTSVRFAAIRSSLMFTLYILIACNFCNRMMIHLHLMKVPFYF